MSTTIIEELTQGLRETREEVRILRLAQREMGIELRTLAGIRPVGRDEKLWFFAVECAAECYSVTPTQVLSRERTWRVSTARQFAYWLCVKVAGWSQSHCGRIANRTHTNISTALQQHAADVAQIRKNGTATAYDAAVARFRAYLSSLAHTGINPSTETPQTPCANAQ